MVPQDHVAITIAVTGCTKGIAIALEKELCQVVGVSEVWIGMTLAKILQWNAVADAAGRCTQQTFQDASRVRTCHRMHGIEGEREVVAKQPPDLIKIEQLLHQRHEVIYAIDHLH